MIRRVSPYMDNPSAADEKVAHVSQLKPFHQSYIDSALFQVQPLQPGTSDRQRTPATSDGLLAQTVIDDSSRGDDSSGPSSEPPDSPPGDNECAELRRPDRPRRLVQPPRWLQDYEI